MGTTAPVNAKTTLKMDMGVSPEFLYPSLRWPFSSFTIDLALLISLLKIGVLCLLRHRLCHLSLVVMY